MKNKKGFSFLEIIIATSISVLIIMATTVAFSKLYESYQHNRSMIKNLENAQYAINSMAKTIRTSRIIEPAAAGIDNSIKFYSYSDGGKCISYRLSGNRIEGASRDNPGTSEPDKITWCSGQSFGGGDYSYMTDSYVDSLQFAVVPSDRVSATKSVGKATILLNVCSAASCAGPTNERTKIETSVSLRDYSGIL